MHTVGAIFDFPYNQENLLRECEHNRIPSACQSLHKTMGDFGSVKMNDELERFVVMVRKNKDLKTINDFPIYIQYIKNNYWKCIQARV